MRIVGSSLVFIQRHTAWDRRKHRAERHTITVPLLGVVRVLPRDTLQALLEERLAGQTVAPPIENEAPDL